MRELIYRFGILRNYAVKMYRGYYKSSLNAGLSYPATVDALKEEGQKLLHELHNPPDSLVWGERGK